MENEIERWILLNVTRICVPLLLWERRSSLDTCRGVTRDVGKGEDARMRFNKCHRPQVGDVLAPQTRLQGVRFPLDLDNSALPARLHPPLVSS